MTRVGGIGPITNVQRRADNSMQFGPWNGIGSVALPFAMWRPKV